MVTTTTTAAGGDDAGKPVRSVDILWDDTLTYFAVADAAAASGGQRHRQLLRARLDLARIAAFVATTCLTGGWLFPGPWSHRDWKLVCWTTVVTCGTGALRDCAERWRAARAACRVAKGQVSR